MIMEADGRTQEISIPLRQSRSIVNLAILLAFVGTLCLTLLFVASPAVLSSLIVSPLLWIAFFVFLAPLLACIFYRYHARLILSKTGLRWRTWGDWRRASWDGVTDYYDQPSPSDGESVELMTVETDTGNIVLDRHWRESEKVRRLIQQQARQTAATEWGVLGQRTTETDARTFAYGQKHIWFFVIFGIGFCLPYTAMGWHWLLGSHPQGGSFWGMFTQAWTPGDLWGSLFGIAFIVLLLVFAVFVISGPMLIILASLPGILDVLCRRSERIIVRHDGIAFDDGRQHVSVAWNEITGYFLQPSMQSLSSPLRMIALSSSPKLAWRWVYFIETTQGSFEYSTWINGSTQLGQIIREHAMPLQGRGSAAK